MKGNNPVSRHVYLVALGANQKSTIGDPLTTLCQALDLLQANIVEITARSRWRKTPAFPPGSGPDFVNGAAVVKTSLGPEALLALLHETEHMLGRQRLKHWGPRVCDLDLIACGDLVTPDKKILSDWMALGARAAELPSPDRLILPHPRMHERAFVLAPLNDIAPDWCHPVTGLTVSEMLAALPQAERDEVELLE